MPADWFLQGLYSRQRELRWKRVEEVWLVEGVLEARCLDLSRPEQEKAKVARVEERGLVPESAAQEEQYRDLSEIDHSSLGSTLRSV